MNAILQQGNRLATKQVLVAFLFCLLAAILSNWPLFFFDTIWPGDDLAHTYRYARQFHSALSEGVWYPRWLSESNRGLGEPAFIYYQPVYFYVVAGLMRGAGDVWLAIKWCAFLTQALLGFLTYLLCRRHVGQFFSLLATIAICFAPFLFHILNFHNLAPWHTSALGVMGVLWCADRLLDSPRPRMSLGLALAFAFLVGCHLMSGLMMLICLPFVCLAFFHRSPWPEGLRRSAGLGASLALGMGLAGVYLVPTLTTWNLIRPDTWFEPHHMDWHTSFAFPTFTLARYGPRWLSVQWGIGASALAYFIALAVSLGTRTPGPDKRDVLRPALLLFLLPAVFLASDLSYPVWAHITFLQKMAWPYRFLLVISLAGIPGAILCIPRGQGFRPWRVAAWALPLAAGMVLTLAYQYQVMKQGAPPRFDPAGLVDHFGRPVMNYWTPRSRGPAWESYAEQGGLDGECQRLGITIAFRAVKSHDKQWELVLPEPRAVRLPVLSFPAWGLTVDGQPAAYVTDPATGAITVAAPSGRHSIRLRWKGLPQEKIGGTISMLAGLTWLGIAWARHRKGRAPPKGHGY